MDQSQPPAFEGRLVYRTIAFSFEAFEYLKGRQRAYEATEQCRLTNAQVLDRVLREVMQAHPQ